MTARRIVSVEIEDARGGLSNVFAKTFIDGTYEGDLAAAAKVPYRVGREGRDEYGESLAGIHYMNWKTGQPIPTPDTGEPSPAIQAFCAASSPTIPRSGCRSRSRRPTSSTSEDFLPLLDDFATGRVKARSYGTPLPGRKFQLNGSIDALTSLNCPGVSWTWPEAGRHHRARLERFHVDHAAGLIWFLQHEPRVPEKIRTHWLRAGLHRDEFADNGHWPWQIYVPPGPADRGPCPGHAAQFHRRPEDRPHAAGRAADRPRRALVRHPPLPRPAVRRRRLHGRRALVSQEGVRPGAAGTGPLRGAAAQDGRQPAGAGGISRAHIAMSVLRMEPVWMTTGQVAGLAAAEAMHHRTDVADIDPTPLPRLLKLEVDPYSKLSGVTVAAKSNRQPALPSAAILHL